MRPILVLLVLASLALAGCASSPPREQPAAIAGAPVVVTSLDDASSLNNSTFMNESHLHDYWGGRTELTVLDKAVETGATVIGPELVFATRPDGGHVVPQGTDAVTISVEWPGDPQDTFGAVELWVATPHDHDARKVADIKKGEPIVISTTLADADVPHQQLSAWLVQLHVKPMTSAPLVTVRSAFHVTMRAHRGLDIPLFPPHPDAWKGRDAVMLLDEEVPLSIWDGAPPDDYRCYGSCPRVHRPVNGTIVPFDAQLVEVTIRMDDPSVDTLGLKFHGGDSWNWTKIAPVREDGKTRYWRIPVTPLMGDGPYAAKSLWEFVPIIEKPVADGDHVGTYHVTARALRHVAS